MEQNYDFSFKRSSTLNVHASKNDEKDLMKSKTKKFDKDDQKVA
jgi:hypothetical protein